VVLSNIDDDMLTFAIEMQSKLHNFAGVLCNAVKCRHSFDHLCRSDERYILYASLLASKP
jgi:hypothetical protein